MYFIVYFYYALFRVVSAKTGLQCILFILDNGDCLLTRIIFSLCFFVVVFLMSLCVICLYFVHRHLCIFPIQDLTMKLSLIQSVGLIARAISECVKKQGYIFSRKQELITVMLVSGN